MTVILSGQSYLTLSCVIPLVLGLESAICNKHPVTETGKYLKQNLLDMIKKRVTVYTYNRTAAKSIFLDPRF